ncbi:hypothetical protein MTR67_043741 [Solanum verrucosum]|uniref:Uncharacterized protein n=1 Tax=Solanum verrucosum TaxID=315347 RepID=A0AAF0ZSY8_SOLVR|nr:hypothetical protein MTR67_043741 [Solanum verrucosum]
MAKGPRLPKKHLATANHDQEGLHDPWWPLRVVVPPVVGEAVCPQKCPSQGSPSRATARLVVKITDLGKARGVALASWETCQVGGATGQGTTGRGALDGS